ncbi:hypothetical protein FSP39_018247 [Pinctada imbricata]|uniref:Large ribosomal subunit protein mL50 n=1 Tax=Pinctada imbricata TaxID=66713 RepID=A0AA88XG37_PINIB|nr:hypothetical protein FSP39_018247 [Pinctada imbricata]
MAVWDRLRGKKTDDETKKFTQEMDDDETRKLSKYDGYTTRDRLQSLKKRTDVQTKRAYQPKPNTEEIMEKIVTDVCGPQEDWKSVSLDDRKIKYQLLTKFLKELDHNMHSNELNDIKTVEDAVKYFTTEVKDTTVIEDFTKLDLPKNLSINTEYIRWDPDNDSLFDGKTAFPGEKTIVTSVKYRRKYPQKRMCS